MNAEIRFADSVSRTERRVLLLPPTQRDAEVIRVVFGENGIDCSTCATMQQLCEQLNLGAAVVVVSEEALSANPECLLLFLSAQPVWADLPVVVLSRAGSESPRLAELLRRVGNVSVVERPVRISTFLSIVRFALRGRTRQYEVREHLKQIRIAEAERSSLLESERFARAEAERAGRMKDEFLATLSHEIRTPLSAILGWIHILNNGDRTGDDLEQGLAIIERNAKAQSQIVADLLDMNRIINGKVRLDVRQVNLATVVRAAIDTVTPSANAKGISLEVALPECEFVSGDPERLQQVFWNLLSNAVKFTPSGGKVRVVLEHMTPDVQARIIDTGEGIDPQFLPHVFDRFRQADGSTTRRHGGLGLGLAIVKQLIELHGGRVRAESAGIGSGSTFIVALPVTADHADRTTVPAETRAAPIVRTKLDPNVNIAGVKVLVVDDEADSRDVVRRLLEDAKARVTTASSANEALQFIDRDPPDVVISDIGMPGEDGYSLIRKLRSRPAESGGRTVAIALTAYARPEDRTNALEAGFQYHVAKPVEPSQLTAAVASAVRNPAGSSFK